VEEGVAQREEYLNRYSKSIGGRGVCQNSRQGPWPSKTPAKSKSVLFRVLRQKSDLSRQSPLPSRSFSTLLSTGKSSALTLYFLSSGLYIAFFSKINSVFLPCAGKYARKPPNSLLYV